MFEATSTAVLGAGLIGRSWAALFAAAGREVAVYDPGPGAEAATRRFIEAAAPSLQALGWSEAGVDDRVAFVADPAEAAEGAGFVQESAPERLEAKHALYAAIEPALAPEALVLSSTSGLTLEVLQGGFQDPSRLIVAHPFNPPHLIPLVELVGNSRTAEGVLARARMFYEALGKVPVTLKRGVPGHIANRLQAAVWREAIHLALEGVASLEDIDKAMVNGPGLRWAAFGPSTLFALGGGAGGMPHFLEHIGPAMQSWWDDLGAPSLDAATRAAVAEQAKALFAERTAEATADERDRLVIAALQERRR